MPCASWCHFDPEGNCGKPICAECDVCGDGSSDSPTEAVRPSEAPGSSKVASKVLRCASWCHFNEANCEKAECAGCSDNCTTSPAVHTTTEHAAPQAAAPRHERPDLSRWPCSSWCRFDAANCAKAACRGCDMCETRPFVCLVWGTQKTMLHTIEFCSADPGAGDWCRVNKQPTPSTTQPGTFSMWQLAGLECCVEGKLQQSSEDCPRFDPRPPGGPAQPPPPPSPAPPPPPLPLPPAPSPPPDSFSAARAAETSPSMPPDAGAGRRGAGRRPALERRWAPRRRPAAGAATALGAAAYS
ncbi:hypothetical protein AB1Y20_017718 [Prymnesium parvum]|uniref:Cellulase n=1 Tax=Prymnesium parvum TaxID=97485 RepID=A0AB34JP94_PRYPA